MGVSVCACFTLQCVRGGLCQRAAIWLDQWATDGDQRAPSIRQRRLQWRHVVELNRGEAANEAFRSCLHHFLVEVLPPCWVERGKVHVVTAGDRFDYTNYSHFWVAKWRMTKEWSRGTVRPKAQQGDDVRAFQQLSEHNGRTYWWLCPMSGIWLRSALHQMTVCT